MIMPGAIQSHAAILVPRCCSQYGPHSRGQAHPLRCPELACHMLVLGRFASQKEVSEELEEAVTASFTEEPHT